MKKILLIIVLAAMVLAGCTSLEVETARVENLKNKLTKIEEKNSAMSAYIEEYKRKIQGLKDEIASIEKEILATKTSAEQYEVISSFSNEVPESLEFQKKYPGKLPSRLNYVFVKSRRINLRENPTTLSKIVSNAVYYDKLTLLEEVVNKSGHKWYKVLDEKGREVFVHSKVVEKRVFDFNGMLNKINSMDMFINGEIENGRKIGSIKAYIPNPDNKDLKTKEDKYGNVEDQGAVAYYENGILYIPDRTIISIVAQDDKVSEIKVPYVQESLLYVENEFIGSVPSITSSPDRAIVVDTRNQNLGVFERKNGKWTLISYAYSKTGVEKKLGFKTPKGFFIVPNTIKTMLYKNEDGEKQGYAKNAIRFSGGGYIHATPFDFDEDEEMKRVWKEYALGTYPGTRKCVRNSLEHAEFLFNWILDGNVSDTNFQDVKKNTAVIVM